MPESAPAELESSSNRGRFAFDRCAAAIAGLFLFWAWSPFQSQLINVVTYESVAPPARSLIGALAIPTAIVAMLFLMGMPRRIPASAPRPLENDSTAGGGCERGFQRRHPWVAFGSACTLTGLAFIPGFGADVGLLYACAVAICAGWVAANYAYGMTIPRWWVWVDLFAPGLLGVSILSSALWHAAEQFNFFQHFSLGYADIGFFVTELEYCLPWKDVPARFADTRMGYHCIPFFYFLAPLYALFRSPAFLMVVGPLALNLAAVAFYQLARHRGARASVALLVSVAWLALPSLSRLPYANTYGFQSIYLAVPWLAFTFSLGLRGRWISSHVCLAAAMLCEETVCGVAFGWGLYLAFWSPRRRDGLLIVAASLAYLAFTTLLVIPFFAGSGSYSRLNLFGEAGAADLVERLVRPRVGWYLLALGAPLTLGLVRSRAALKLLIVAAPTLLLVLLLRNDDYLNIKYWHQASVLPVLFSAAVVGIAGRGPGAEGSPTKSGLAARDRGTEGRLDLRSQISNRGAASPVASNTLGLLTTVLLFHQLLGFSPVAQAYGQYIKDAAMQSPDPRMQAVEWVRSHYPPETTTILATERMAAHFCDYRAVCPLGSGPILSGARPPRLPQANGAGLLKSSQEKQLIIVDRSDTWDPVIRERGWQWLIETALAAGYTQGEVLGPVAILVPPRR